MSSDASAVESNTHPSLCFVITCMGRLSHLRQTLASAVAQSGCSCVVVDYSCPERCGDWVEANHPQVRVVRVEGKTTYSQSIARNAGSRAVDADWICFRDADIVLAPTFAEQIVPLLRPGAFYVAQPLVDDALCGTFICARGDFERVGGYDEVYEGWGDEDLDLYAALQSIGIRTDPFSSALLSHVSHDEKARTQFHEIKERGISWTINRLYRVAKFDLLRLVGRPLPLEDRQSLYRTISGTVRSLQPEDRQRQITVNLGRARVDFPGGGTLDRTLVYNYNLPG